MIRGVMVLIAMSMLAGGWLGNRQPHGPLIGAAGGLMAGLIGAFTVAEHMGLEEFLKFLWL